MDNIERISVSAKELARIDPVEASLQVQKERIMEAYRGLAMSKGGDKPYYNFDLGYGEPAPNNFVQFDIDNTGDGHSGPLKLRIGGEAAAEGAYLYYGLTAGASDDAVITDQLGAKILAVQGFSKICCAKPMLITEIRIRTADALRRTCRGSDIIARIGGDEFVILMTYAGKINTEVFLTRLQYCLKQQSVKLDHDYTLSVSAGMAEYNSNEQSSLKDLLDLADRSMYEQKKAKRHK